MRPGELQVILALVARDVCAPPCPWLQMTTPRVICSSAVAAGLFLDVGNSHPLGNVVCMHHFIVICLSKPWCVVSVVFVAISGLSVAHGVLRDVVFWAWKHDVMYKIRGRSFNLLIHIYIYVYVKVSPENIVRKVGILVCFEIYSGIILGRLANSINLMECPEVKWYERLVGNFWRHIFSTSLAMGTKEEHCVAEAGG